MKRYVCEICGETTTRRRAMPHDLGSYLRRACREEGISGERQCTTCGRRCQVMPIHRQCEYGGAKRMPSGCRRCPECGRMQDAEEIRRQGEDNEYYRMACER